MRTRALVAATGTLALAAALTGPLTGTADAHSRHHRDLVRAPLVGSLPGDPAIFGVTAGGLPWDLERGSVRLRPEGRLRLDVRGLVIPGTGVGPVTHVTASLFCNGTLADTTDAARLSKHGNARIRDRVDVPRRCLAPVVFVNPNGNTSVYIAVTGAQR